MSISISNKQAIDQNTKSLETNEECEISLKDFELCEHLVNFLLMVNSKKSSASEENSDKNNILNQELYCLNCKGFFDLLNKNEHGYHEILNQGKDINNTYFVSEIFEKIEKKFFSNSITEEEFVLKNLETDFNSEIEKSIQNVHSLLLKLKERKILEFSKFKQEYDANFEIIKKDFFDLKFKFSKFYMKNEVYFFPKSSVSNLNKSKFDNTISDIIYLINLDLFGKVQQAEKKLEAHIASEKIRAFGQKDELHTILVKFNNQIQSLLEMQISFNAKEKIFPDFAKDLDISLKKFSQVFEDLNKAFVNIKNPVFTNKFEDYLTEAENDFFIKYFAKLAESSVYFKGAAYEKKRLISVQNKNVFNYLEKNPVNRNNRFYEVVEPHIGKNSDLNDQKGNGVNNRNKSSVSGGKNQKNKLEWETNDDKCVYNEIENFNLLDMNNSDKNRQRYSVQVDEQKSKKYFENFLKNKNDENNNNVNNHNNHNNNNINNGLKRSFTQISGHDRSTSPPINRVIRDAERDLNDKADKNYSMRNTINLGGQSNSTNRIVNNNLIERNKNENYNHNKNNANNEKIFDNKSKSFMINSQSFQNNKNNNNDNVRNKTSHASADNMTFDERNSNTKKKTFNELPAYRNSLLNKSNISQNKKKNSIATNEENFNIKNRNLNRNESNNSFNEFNARSHYYNKNHEDNNRREISRSNSFVAINPNLNKTAKDFGKSLSRKNSEININFANNSLKRSNSVFNKNDISLLQNNSSKKLLRKNSSSFLRSTIDDSVVNSKSKLGNFKRKSSFQNNNKNYHNNNNNNSNANDFSDYENESAKEQNTNQIRNKRSASQLNIDINKSKNYFFDNNAVINFNNINVNSSEKEEEIINRNKTNNNKINNINGKNKSTGFRNFDDDKIRYIMNINKNNSRHINTTTKKTINNYNLVNPKNNNNNNNKKTNNKNEENNNNNNITSNVNSAKIKFLNNYNYNKADKKNFKTIQVIAPQVILNVFHELMDSKELNAIKPYKDKEYFEKLKHSIEFKLYLLKKFFILQLLVKFNDLDDKNFSDYCSNNKNKENKNDNKNSKGFGTNFSNYSEYNILLNENHLENLTNYIIPKIKVLTNEILIFNKRNNAIYKHYVPLNYEEHGIGYFLDGCRYIVANEKIYISGGRDEERYYSVFLEYDYISNSVRRLADLCFARAYHKMLFCHNSQKIYFLGGENNKSCEIYDLFNNVNLPLPSLNEARCYLNAYVSCDGKRLYALFGIKGKIFQSEFSDKVEVLDLDACEGQLQDLLKEKNQNNILYQMELKKKNCGYDNTIKISNVETELAKITCGDYFKSKWRVNEYKNLGDIDLKFRYVGVYPLEKDILLLIGGCLYREINLMISVFDFKKNQITKVNEDIVGEIMRRAKDDAVLMKILAEINRNIYK